MLQLHFKAISSIHLSKIICQKWKKIDPVTKRYVEEVAQILNERHTLLRRLVLSGVEAIYAQKTPATKMEGGTQRYASSPTTRNPSCRSSSSIGSSIEYLPMSSELPTLSVPQNITQHRLLPVRQTQQQRQQQMSIADMSVSYEYHNMQQNMSSLHQQTLMPQSLLWNNEPFRANSAPMTQEGISTDPLNEVSVSLVTEDGDQSSLLAVPQSVSYNSYRPPKLKQQDDDGAFTSSLSSECSILPTNNTFLPNICLECRDNVPIENSESSSSRREKAGPLPLFGKVDNSADYNFDNNDIMGLYRALSLDEADI